MIKEEELDLFKRCSENNSFSGDKFWVAYINNRLFHTRSDKSMFNSKEAIIRAMKQSIGRDMKKNYVYYLEKENEFRNKLKTFKTRDERHLYIEKRVDMIFNYMLSNNLIVFKEL